MSASARKSSPVHDQLAEVKWKVPSVPPDTSSVDDAWSQEPRPRRSYIALRQSPGESLPAPRPALLPLPPSVRAAVSARPVLPVTTELAYDLWQGPTAWLVLVDLPGVDAEQVSLSLGSRALYLEVNVPGDAPRAGVASGRHSLCIELPTGSWSDELDASLGQGVLRVRIPVGSLGPRQVSIRSSD